jgi:hypothetical protein
LAGKINDEEPYRLAYIHDYEDDNKYQINIEIDSGSSRNYLGKC